MAFQFAQVAASPVGGWDLPDPGGGERDSRQEAQVNGYSSARHGAVPKRPYRRFGHEVRLQRCVYTTDRVASSNPAAGPPDACRMERLLSQLGSA